MNEMAIIVIDAHVRAVQQFHYRRNRRPIGSNVELLPQRLALHRSEPQALHSASVRPGELGHEERPPGRPRFRGRRGRPPRCRTCGPLRASRRGSADLVFAALSRRPPSSACAPACVRGRNARPYRPAISRSRLRAVMVSASAPQMPSFGSRRDAARPHVAQPAAHAVHPRICTVRLLLPYSDPKRWGTWSRLLSATISLMAVVARDWLNGGVVDIRASRIGSPSNSAIERRAAMRLTAGWCRSGGAFCVVQW